VTITQPTEAAAVPSEADDAEPVAEAPTEEPAAEAVIPEAAAAEAPEAGTAPEPEAGAAAALEAGETPEAEPKPQRTRAPRGERAAGRRTAASGDGAAARPARDRRTTAQRLGNFPRADRPADIPAPEHHHLPGWVRRDFARARPPLSNILALLEGEVHDQYEKRIAELTEGISSGKFSLAWQYPDLVDEGRALYERQRRDTAENARANRQLDTARRRVIDRIRDAGDALPPDVSARLQRQLRSAGDAEAIAAVSTELDGMVSVAKSSAEKRREREIERTKARIMRSAAAAGAAAPTPQTETWQDVLRRFAEQQAAGSTSE
jgi:hypothetical protein